VILGRDLATVHPVDPGKIAEYVTHSWYEYSVGDQASRRPAEGENQSEILRAETALPRPRHRREVLLAEVAAVRRQADGSGSAGATLVAYASGDAQVKKSVDAVLAKFNAPPTVLFSTLGRIAARAIEADIMVEKLPEWIAQLDDNMAHGDVRIHNGDKWDPESWPKSCAGFGLEEAPRGSLGHWVEIENKKIVNYQCIVPSTWNAGPRDAHGPAWRLRGRTAQHAHRRPRAPAGSASAPFIPSIPAWPALCTWSTGRAAATAVRQRLCRIRREPRRFLPIPRLCTRRRCREACDGHARSSCSSEENVAAGEEHLVPVYVWELPVRLAHWGIVAAVTVLTWTGLYMNHPFLIFPGPRSWTMGRSVSSTSWPV